MKGRSSRDVEWTVEYVTGPSDYPGRGEITVYAEDVVSALRKAAKKVPFGSLILNVEMEVRHD